MVSHNILLFVQEINLVTLKFCQSRNMLNIQVLETDHIYVHLSKIYFK